MPHLSVIIPTYNSEKTLEKCLKSIKESDYEDYELIIVDGASQDATRSVAKKYTDKVIELTKNSGRSHARHIGITAAEGEIIVCTDSDNVISPDTLTKINDFLSRHREFDALTGILSKEHPNTNFFSQYKNLYMNYIFKKLPTNVTFLHGSIYAIRRSAIATPDFGTISDDTACGQKLFLQGKHIAFLRDLEVTHLKKYTLLSFIKNDFQIPFNWAKIFLKYKGWRQLGRNKTGFAHSPKEQLVSVILAPAILLSSLVALFGYSPFFLILLLILVWLFLNFSFFMFLGKERGLFFGMRAFFVTFLDNIVMALGILCGFTIEGWNTICHRVRL